MGLVALFYCRAAGWLWSWGGGYFGYVSTWGYVNVVVSGKYTLLNTTVIVLLHNNHTQTW